ncbi:MAG: polyprenyl synthetase family protein, partial [Planctomycetota bacterium]|nr:polyprenyl synthetase family protein [Planctomycetota bacterium]
MLDLRAINRPVADLLERELREVTVIFERQLASELSAVNGLCMHIEQYRGKMLRPTLVLLSGLTAAGEPCDGAALNEKHRTVAAVVELIHMATLVH